MQIFLPDFLTINPQTSKPVLNLKGRTSPVRKNIHTQRDKPRNHKTRTLQSSQTLRAKSLQTNNDNGVFKRNCFDFSFANQINRLPMFPNQNNDLIHCRKTNNFRLYNSPRVKTSSKPIVPPKQQKNCTVNSMTSPFLLTKSFNYQQKMPKLPKTAEVKRKNNNITQIKYKNDISNSFYKLGKLFHEQNSIYRPWSPTKNQFAQQELK